MAAGYRGASERGNIVTSILGWMVFAALFAFLVWVGYKTWVYYGKIRRGEVVELPQYKSQFTSSKTPSLDQPDVDRNSIESEDGPALGADPANAKLTIVEFADFECPYSKLVSPVVRTLLAKYGDRVRFVYRYYPLDDIHVNAKQAAIAAECAQEQGKFWAYHDRLYQNSPALGYSDLLRYSQEAGLDPKQFEKCLNDQRYKAKVESDQSLAVKTGVGGTPVFFFNGQKVEGAIPADIFERLIQRMAPAQ